MRHLTELRNAYLGQRRLIDGRMAEITCYQVVAGQMIVNVTYDDNGSVERIVIN